MSSGPHGPIQRLPKAKRVLARSVEQAERAADGVLARLAVSVGMAVEGNTIPGQPITDLQREAIMQDVDRMLATTYGYSRETADQGELGSILAAQAHNARIRVATHAVETTILPAAKRDPELQRAMGIRDEEVR